MSILCLSPDSKLPARGKGGVGVGDLKGKKSKIHMKIQLYLTISNHEIIKIRLAGFY